MHLINGTSSRPPEAKRTARAAYGSDVCLSTESPAPPPPPAPSILPPRGYVRLIIVGWMRFTTVVAIADEDRLILASVYGRWRKVGNERVGVHKGSGRKCRSMRV